VWTDNTDPFGFVSVVDDWLVGCAVMMMTISCCWCCRYRDVAYSGVQCASWWYCRCATICICPVITSVGLTSPVKRPQLTRQAGGVHCEKASSNSSIVVVDAGCVIWCTYYNMLAAAADTVALPCCIIREVFYVKEKTVACFLRMNASLRKDSRRRRWSVKVYLVTNKL